MNLDQYAGLGSHISWHRDNERLFGPQSSPKLFVSVSLGYSLELQVRRRATDGVPSPTSLDHGDHLVMDGLAQSECVHLTVSGLQGPLVNLTFTEHIASCPTTGVMRSTFVCARFSRARSPGKGKRADKVGNFFVDGPPFVNLGVLPTGA